MTIPTHLIMVLNRETFELKLVSAHESDDDAGYAFSSLSSLFGSTPNDVHKVTVPVASGFVEGEILSSSGKSPALVTHKGMYIQPGAIITDDGEGMVTRLPEGHKPRNGIHRNERGEYVQKFADGSEIISSSDFGDE